MLSVFIFLSVLLFYFLFPEVPSIYGRKDTIWVNNLELD